MRTSCPTRRRSARGLRHGVPGRAWDASTDAPAAADVLGDDPYGAMLRDGIERALSRTAGTVEPATGAV